MRSSVRDFLIITIAAPLLLMAIWLIVGGLIGIGIGMSEREYEGGPTIGDSHLRIGFQWTPDDTHIIFEKRMFGLSDGDKDIRYDISNIHVVESDGSRLWEISDSPEDSQPHETDLCPDISPG